VDFYQSWTWTPFTLSSACCKEGLTAMRSARRRISVWLQLLGMPGGGDGDGGFCSGGGGGDSGLNH